MSMTYVYEFVLELSPAQICQLFYVLSAAAVLAIAAVPERAQQLLTQYGARGSDKTLTSTSTSTRDHKDISRGYDDSSTGSFFRLISCLTSIGKIPHSWFMHFYILSLSCTVFWAIQFVTHGPVLELIVNNQCLKSTSSMTMSQVILVWFFMALQAIRRLYEYLAVLRTSSSRMWIIHWLLGNAFYLCTSVSIWVEGSRSIQCFNDNCLVIGIPPLKSVIASSVFLVSWAMQYQCHRHLAGLKKYSLPEDGLFRYLVCPHYTCECMLYLSLTAMAAPEGQLYNQTLACAVLFVLANLGVTAHGTKLWYGEKFGSRVKGRWTMIPVVF
ncbi:hypothetical protein GGR51DRAFT_564893 [Nemania sp. FL0031]|nr:hypothetical protein GGR51DRAFT_564893 [Nemania sp. FL0031]